MHSDYAQGNHPRLRSGVAAFAVPSAPACWSAVSTGAVWTPGAESPLPVALLLTSSMSKLQSRQQPQLGCPCGYLAIITMTLSISTLSSGRAKQGCSYLSAMANALPARG